MFQGCGTALVTPFKADQSLDEAALRRLVRRQLEAGVHFLCPCGTTGESPTLTEEEQLRVVEIVLEEAKGKVPVVAGAGGYNTAKVIRLVEKLESLGVDGILSVTPYYNKPTQEGLYAHYAAIAKSTKLPIIVYNVPGRTGVNIEPATMRRLAEDFENIKAIKEASGNISQIARLLQIVPEGFSVLSGDDAVTLPLMALGGKGVISVVSNELPAEMAELAELCLKNDFAAALQIHRRIFPLMEANFVETNPIPVKAALAMMGLIEPVYRLPLVPPKPSSLEKIEQALVACGIKIERSIAAYASGAN